MYADGMAAVCGKRCDSEANRLRAAASGLTGRVCDLGWRDGRTRANTHEQAVSKVRSEEVGKKELSNGLGGQSR